MPSCETMYPHGLAGCYQSLDSDFSYFGGVRNVGVGYTTVGATVGDIFTYTYLSNYQVGPLSLEFEAIPEPSTIALGMLGLLPFLRVRLR